MSQNRITLCFPQIVMPQMLNYSVFFLVSFGENGMVQTIRRYDKFWFSPLDSGTFNPCLFITNTSRIVNRFCSASIQFYTVKIFRIYKILYSQNIQHLYNFWVCRENRIKCLFSSTIVVRRFPFSLVSIRDFRASVKALSCESSSK